MACAQGSIDLSLLVNSSISKACVAVNDDVFGVVNLMHCAVQAATRQCMRPNSFLMELRIGEHVSTVKVAADSKGMVVLLFSCSCSWTSTVLSPGGLRELD